MNLDFNTFGRLIANYHVEKTEKNRHHDLLLKVENFCGYRERCTFEVKQKLIDIGATETETTQVIASLTEDDFLNDERFARLFASVKFRIKRWGKNKIRAELRMKKLTDSMIQKGLAAIDMDAYQETIEHLIKKKSKELKNKDAKSKNQKIVLFLLSKGYESDLVWKAIKKISVD